MLKVSNKYLDTIDSYLRTIITRAYFNGSSTPLIWEVMSAKVNESGQSTDSLVMGDLCTNMATLKFIMPSTPISLENGYFRLEHGVMVDGEYEYVNVGTYYISEIDTVEGSNQFEIKGYDKSTRFSKDYVPTVTVPCTVKDIVEDICEQCNVELDASYVFPNITVESMYEGDCKETLKYMAGLMGKNAKINRDGKLTFYWYGEPVRTIGQDIQFMGGFKKTTEEDITIHSLTSGSENNTIVSGEGRGISFANPYMTQEILDGILEDVRGFTYTPSTTSYRGNPALEIGDVVNVEDRDGNLKRVLIGEHELILTGMKASISSKGSTEVETVIKQSPSEIRLKKAIGVLKESFKESTELITGNKGGHYVIDYDENGQPIGFKIMDTPTLTENTKLWMFNKNGFGFSEDGGKTLKNIAIDMLGNINANVVTTGALVGEHFELNLEEGSLIMGERDSQGNFKDIWLECSDKGFLIGSSSQSVVSCTIESTNGFYIIDSVESTELTARIYVDGEEIDKDGLLSYVWFISTDGGEVFEELARGKTITLETSLLNANTKIYFETED